MSSETPWVRWFWSDYNADTAHLDLMQLGAYQRLLGYIYQREQPLPGEIEKICRLCHATSAMEQTAVRQVLEEYFMPFEDPERGLCYRHLRAEREIDRARTLKGVNSGRAKAAAEARWAVNDAPSMLQACSKHSSSNAPSNAPSNAQAMPPRKKKEDLDSSSLRSEETRQKSQQRKQAQTRINQDWTPGPSAQTYIDSFHATPQAQQRAISDFIAYWTAKGDARANWDLAFVKNPVARDTLAKGAASAAQQPQQRRRLGATDNG